MRTVHFVVNPIAGKGRLPFDEAMLSKYFCHDDYDLKVKVSEYPGHATLLAQESLESGAEVIVACGGDGTINEVASCLVHTDVVLAIVPIGSGNGLASSLKIPKNVSKAISLIKNGTVTQIDVAMVNGKHFLSNMGIGFDASVISNYDNSEQRRFRAYFKAVIKSIKNYRNTDKIRVEMNGATLNTSPFMFFVSNSKVMGYDFSLTRMASMQDGLLDVVIIDSLSKGEILLLGVLLLFRASHYLKKVKYHKVKELKIAFVDKRSEHMMQTDGELQNLAESEISINIKERALNVLVP